MDIGTRIKELRQALRLSQTEFARKLGKSKRTIQLWESGNITPPEPAISLIEQTFNVNPSWLREGKGEMFKPKNEEFEELLQKLGLDDEKELEKLKDLLQAYVTLPPEEKELYYHEIKARALRKKLEERSGSKF